MISRSKRLTVIRIRRQNADERRLQSVAERIIIAPALRLIVPTHRVRKLAFMSAVIRPAQGSDLNALVDLEEQAFNGDRFSRRQLWHLVHRANAQTLVIEADGQLLGYGTLLLRRNSRNARLYSLGVAPGARGHGHGRQLLEALEALCPELGCHLLTLEVRADNRTALALYRRSGFRLISWIEDYYEDGCAAWRMRKTMAVAQMAG